MGSPVTFKDFLKSGIREFPAEHSWSLWRAASAFMGTMDDDVSNDFIQTNELEQALNEVKSETGRDIDILAINACETANAGNGVCSFGRCKIPGLPGGYHNEFGMGFRENGKDNERKG